MKTKAVLVSLLSALLVLTGCSVGAEDQRADKPTIRIGYQTFPSGDLIVKNNRWLEEALPDYNIRWTKFDSGADVNTAFIAGELDFGALGSSPVARGLSAPLNIPYKVVFILDVAGDNEALVARNDAGIDDIAQLRGKRIATPFASTAHYSLLAALDQNGLTADDVTLIDLQPQAILAAWERGDIDAAYTWLPTLDQLRATGRDLITSRQLADAGKPTLDLATVSDEFAAAHPEVVDTWRQQQVRALGVIRDDPQAAATAIAAEVGLSPEDVAGQLEQMVFVSAEDLSSPEWLGTAGNPGNLAANLQSASQFLADQKQIPEAGPLTTFQRRSTPRGSPMPSASDGVVRIEGVSHRYGSGRGQVTALGPVDLTVDPGSFVVLVGASGCGKSTLLRLLAGFEEPTQGAVHVAGRAPTPGVTAGVVFQQPRLFPWRTVGGNLDLALKYAKVPRDRRADRRDELLERVGLVGMGHRRIWEISGGQQQRVAIARALAAETPLFLLDEPFAALDALTRERLQEDVRQVSAESGRTTVFVTHSADEAAFLGSRIVVLTRRPGQVALDIPVDLPRTGVDPDDLRRSPEYAELRAEVGRAVKSAAASRESDTAA